MRFTRSLPYRPALVAATLFLLAMPYADIGAQRPPRDRTVWPRGPEPARIQYVGTLASERDIGANISRFAKIRFSITGEKATLLAILRRPHDIFVDPQSRWWVTDMGRRQILRFDPNNRSARVVGASASDDSTLATPLGLTGDARGFIYIADGMRHRVVVLNAAGIPVRFIGEGVLLNPVDVALDELRGRLYVCDSFLHQVVVFNLRGEVIGRLGRNVAGVEALSEAIRRIDLAPTTHSGVPQRVDLAHSKPQRGPKDIDDNRGSASGEFRYPSFIALAPNGHLFVSDVMNFRIQEFDGAGVFIRSIGEIGDIPGTFTRPKGLAVDSDGNLFVADAAFNNIQVFNSKGELLMAFPDRKSADGQLALPEGVYIDASDRIMVADSFNGRVQLYLRLRP